MIELRHRPSCSGCGDPVSSDADGCEVCGYLLLCDDCVAEHEMRHDAETAADTSRQAQDAEFQRRFGFPLRRSFP